MFIKTQATPNPATIKFMPGQAVLPDGTAEFKTKEECTSSTLADRLFALQGVTGVFFADDFIAVTKADDTDWSMLQPMVLAAIMEHFSLGLPVITGADTDGNAITDEDDEITAQIKELIITRVRPAVAQDGGDIVFGRFENGVVYLHMKGACAGCPSSTATLKAGIENMLRHFVPEVNEVQAMPE